MEKSMADGAFPARKADKDNLAALETKIASVLGMKPQCFITHPAELFSLKRLTLDAHSLTS